MREAQTAQERAGDAGKDREFEQHVLDSINKLFTKCITGEPSAYITLGEERYVYRTLVNGAWKDELEPATPLTTLPQALELSLAAVESMWPDHARMQLVWRHWPAVEHERAYRASRRLGWPARPAFTQLYMRLVATPVV